MGERARERLPGEHVAAHAGEELTLAFALGLLDGAFRACSMVRPAASSVASWRVRSASAAAPSRRRPNVNPCPVPDAFAAIGSTSTGSQPCSRRRNRAWRGLSDSSTPRWRLPSGASAS